MSQSTENLETSTKHAVIYLTGGGDTAMRDFCEMLLKKSQAIRVELLKCSEMFFKDNGKRKISMQSRKMMILCPSEHVDSIFSQIPRGMEAIAVPVVRHLKRPA